MKKLVTFALLAAAGYAIWRKLSEDQDDRDLWAEVTDNIA